MDSEEPPRETLDIKKIEAEKAYVEKIAIAAARKQIAWTSGVLTMALAVCTFFGYDQIMDSAKKEAVAQANARVDAFIKAELEPAVRKRLVDLVVAQLTTEVQRGVDQVIDAQCKNVARLDSFYEIQIQNPNGWVLARDDGGSPTRHDVYTAKRAAPVYWKLTH